MRTPGTRPRRRLAALAASTVLLVVAIAIPGSASAVAGPTPASIPPSAPAVSATTTESSMEHSLRVWINRDRALRGLQPLYNDSRLIEFAGERATWMASQGVMSHTSVDGTVCQGFVKRAVRWYRCGEDIGWTTASWGTRAAASLYSLWKHSPTHWALLMSAHFNYLGVGVAYRASSGRTYGSIVFLEGPDRTAPTRAITSRSVSGTTIAVAWTGHDVFLQTHTAGLRGFDVGYEVDAGPLTVIRTNSTAHSITLTGRQRGHVYTIRIRARDRAGNLSSWSSAATLPVP